MPERVSGPPPPGALMLPTLNTHTPRGSFLLAGSGRCPSAFRGPPPPLDAARRGTREPRASFLLAGAALEALHGAALESLDGARARFGPPPT